MNKKTASAKEVTTPLEASSIEVVIEAPKGSRNKFKYDPITHRFKLSKVLPEGMVFPHDFGFVPSTKGADGDPVPCKNSMPLKSLEGRKHYPLHHILQQCTQSSTHFPFSSSPLLAGWTEHQQQVIEYLMEEIGFFENRSNDDPCFSCKPETDGSTPDRLLTFSESSV